MITNLSIIDLQGLKIIKQHEENKNYQEIKNILNIKMVSDYMPTCICVISFFIFADL